MYFIVTFDGAFHLFSVVLLDLIDHWPLNGNAKCFEFYTLIPLFDITFQMKTNNSFWNPNPNNISIDWMDGQNVMRTIKSGCTQINDDDYVNNVNFLSLF